MSAFLQSPQWAKFRASLGWQTHWIQDPRLRGDDILALERSLPFGQSFWYAPEAEVRKLDVRHLVKNIHNINFSHQPIFFRLEILDGYCQQNQKILADLQKHGFVKSFEEVQPEWRQMIDLTLSEDQLLAQMKPKGRYNISVAKRHGVKVKASDDLPALYNLYHLTSERAQVSARTIDYFRQLRSFFPAESQVFVASYQGQPLAAALVIFWEDTATYLYGGSANEHRETMASYLLHWMIMREAKKRGCTKYDFGAVAPMTNDEFPNFRKKIQNSKLFSRVMHSGDHASITREKKLAQKYTGLTRFKQQFGGQTVHIIGSYDLIFKPTWYRLYRFVEMLRRR